MVKILGICGSTQEKSVNKKLLTYTLSLFPKDIEIETISLKDYPLPIYDGDLEKSKGIPKKAKALRDKIKHSTGLVITSPEYNSGISGVLKNMIDWTSRPDGDIPNLDAYTNKSAFILSASPSPLGGIRGLYSLRWVLENIGIVVLPDLVAVGNAYEVFKEGKVSLNQEVSLLLKNGIDNYITMVKNLNNSYKSS